PTKGYIMDILTQAVAETATLNVKSASGEPLYDAEKQPVGIRLYGPGSSAYSQVESRQTQRALKRMEENGGKPTAMTPDERRVQEAEDLAALTVSFENFTYSAAEGKSGTELFKAVYEDQKLGFITNQVAK